MKTAMLIISRILIQGVVLCFSLYDYTAMGFDFLAQFLGFLGLGVIRRLHLCGFAAEGLGLWGSNPGP